LRTGISSLEPRKVGENIEKYSLDKLPNVALKDHENIQEIKPI